MEADGILFEWPNTTRVGCTEHANALLRLEMISIFWVTQPNWLNQTRGCITMSFLARSRVKCTPQCIRSSFIAITSYYVNPSHQCVCIDTPPDIDTILVSLTYILPFLWFLSSQIFHKSQCTTAPRYLAITDVVRAIQRLFFQFSTVF